MPFDGQKPSNHVLEDPKRLRQAFGKVIKYCCNELHMSRQEVADALGVSRQSLDTYTKEQCDQDGKIALKGRNWAFDRKQIRQLWIEATNIKTLKKLEHSLEELKERGKSE
jgi:DNA-binding XRE family transcriptional regulator